MPTMTSMRAGGTCLQALSSLSRVFMRENREMTRRGTKPSGWALDCSSMKASRGRLESEK